MTTCLSPDIAEIAARFAISGNLLAVNEIKSGHINRTYRLDFATASGQQSYLLQKINDYVFKDINGVMNNIAKFLAARPEQLLRLFPAKDGALFYQDSGTGGYWRLYNFIAGGTELDRPTMAELQAGGAAFGAFAAALATLDAADFVETIPRFHHLPQRLGQFHAALAGGAAARQAEVRPLLPDLEKLSAAAKELAEQLDRGLLPKRLAHNDVKLSNILFDKATHKPLAIVDLDTIMPGSPLYDFGDLVRSCAASKAEDEPAGMYLDEEKYALLYASFTAPLKNVLTEQELALMPLAPLAITTELSLRFLADYLAGDKYFAINRPRHNFERGLAQLQLARSMYEKLN